MSQFPDTSYFDIQIERLHSAINDANLDLEVLQTISEPSDEVKNIIDKLEQKIERFTTDIKNKTNSKAQLEKYKEQRSDVSQLQENMDEEQRYVVSKYYNDVEQYV